MIGKLIDARLERELLERRAANLLHHGQREAEKAAREEKTTGLMDLGLDAPSSRGGAKRSKAPNRGAGWNRGMRMWTPSVSERSRRVGGLLRYITTPETQAPKGRDPIEKCVYWNSANFVLGRTVDDHIDEMAAVASMVTRGGDPIAHVIFSLLPGEQPTPAQVDEAVRIFLKEAKFEGCRTVWALHDDRDHVHIHVVVCRVDAITRRMRRWDGDSGWSHDVLGRTVARIDALQGWTSAKNARFVMEGDRVVPARRIKAERSYSQPARRREIESGEASAERRARAAAVGIDLDRISSWQEFHRVANGVGLRFERLGRGLVVDVGAEQIKASQVGRVFSLGRLENRFGAFEIGPPALDEIVPPLKQQQIVPDEIASMQNGVDALRTRIVSRRRDLRSAQAAERKALEERHRRERDDAYGPREGRSFKGEGAELNRLRAEIARRQRTEIEVLTARHRKAREEQSGSIGRAPSLPGLLKGHSRADDANRLSHFLGDRMIEISPSTTSPVVDRQSEKRFRPLGPFSIAVESAGVVEWCQGEVDDPSSQYFEDHGHRLLLPQTTNQEVLLAALTQADHRGGPVALKIPDDLRRGLEDPIVCLAAAHGIPLADNRLEDRRRRLASEWKAQNLLGLPAQMRFDEMHAGVQADDYVITTKKLGHESARGVAWSRDMLGLDAVSPHVVRACLAEIAKSGDRVPYLTPRSADRHFISIDGMDFEQINERNWLGARWSTILMGEDGRLVVVASAPADPARHHDQLLARSRLATRLNGRDGDTCSIPLDPARFGIGRDGGSRTCPLLTLEFKDELARVEQERERDVERRLSAIPDPKVLLVEGTTTDIETARRLSIYAAHARHIVTGVSRLLDDAVVDRLVAWRLTACGFAPDEVGAILSAGSPRVPQDRPDAEKYLARTLSAAHLAGEMDRRRGQLRAPTWKVITDQAEYEALNALASAKVMSGEQAASASRQEPSAEPSPTHASSDLGERTTTVAGTGEDTLSVSPASVATPRHDDLRREAPLRASDPPTTIFPSERTAASPSVATTADWTMPPKVATWLSASPGKDVRLPTVEAGAGTKPPPEPAPSVSGLNRRQAALAFLGGAPQQPASGRSQAALAIDRLEAIIERDVRDFEKLRELRVQNGKLGDEDSLAKERNHAERRRIFDLRQAELGRERRSTGLVSMVPNDVAYDLFLENDTQATKSSKSAPTERTAVAGIYREFGNVLMVRDEDGNVCHGADAEALLEKGARKYYRFAVSRLHILEHAKQLADPIAFIALFEQALVETGRTRDDISAVRNERERELPKQTTTKLKGAVRPKGGGIGDR